MIPMTIAAALQTPRFTGIAALCSKGAASGGVAGDDAWALPSRGYPLLPALRRLRANDLPLSSLRRSKSRNLS